MAFGKVRVCDEDIDGLSIGNITGKTLQYKAAESFLEVYITVTARKGEGYFG